MAVVVVTALVGVVIPAGATATSAGAATPTCGGQGDLPSSGSTLGNTGGNVAGSSGTLTAGQCLTSPDGQYELMMQSDGNLVEYFLPSGQAVWASNTALVAPPIPDFINYSNPYAAMQSDGNLVVYMTQTVPSPDPLFPPTTSTVAPWASGSQGVPDTSLSLQDDANFVIYGTNSAGAYPAWAANTVGVRGSTMDAGQTLQPGQFLVSSDNQYKLELSAKGVLALYSTQPYACPLWTAPAIASSSGYSTTPQSGSYLAIDSTGNLNLESPGTTNPWWSASQTSGWVGGGTSGESLTLETNGNLVLSAAGATIWSSNTDNLRGSMLCTGTDLQAGQSLLPWLSGKSVGPDSAGLFVMQTDCNLVLYFNNTVWWASNTDEGDIPQAGITWGNPYAGCFVTQQTDGNLVVYAPNYPGGEKALWASGTNQSSTVPFNLGAIGPYLTMPIVGNTPAPYVTTIHGNTLGNPNPPQKSDVLKILGDVFDALSLVFTFVAGPLGAVGTLGDAAGNALGIASIASGVGGTAVAGASGAQSNATGPQPGAISPHNSSSPVTVTTCDGSSPSQVVGNSYIEPGGCLLSPNGQYELRMQTDGNLVLYQQSQNNPIWASNTGVAGDYATLQTDGNLIVNGVAGLAWQSGITTATNPLLALQDDGNLVVNGPNAVWASNSTVLTACGAASPTTISAGAIIASGGCLISPNKQYELIMQTDGNLVLYYLNQGDPLWATNTAGNPGAQLRLWPSGGMSLQAPGNIFIWSSPTNMVPSAVLALQDNGNVQEFGNNSTLGLAVISYSAWQSGTTNLRGWSLPSGSNLSPGQFLMSPNGTYKLSMGTNGLLELSYITQPLGQSGSYFCPMWSRPSGSLDLTGLAVNGDKEIYQPALNAGSYLAMQTDGNAVLIPGTGSSVFGVSGSNGNPGAALYLQSDGNVVIYSANGTALWASGTNNDRGSTLCTNGTLLPGQFLTAMGTPGETTTNVAVMGPNCELSFYGNSAPGNSPYWSTSGGLTPGSAQAAGCYAVMQGDGNFVIYAPNNPPPPSAGGNTAIWSSGTQQSDLPPNLVSNAGPFSLINPNGVTTAVDGANSQGVEILTDSAIELWQDPSAKGSNAAADGSTAVAGVQSLVGFLVFLLPFLL